MHEEEKRVKSWTDEEGIRWFDFSGAVDIDEKRVEEWIAETIAGVKKGFTSWACASGNRSVRAAWHWEDGDIVIEVMQPIRIGRLAWNRPVGLKAPEEM